MKVKLLGLMALVILLGMSQASAETLVGTTSDATGIDGLVIDSVTYDVTFANGSYNALYGTPTFYLNQPGAEDAAIALQTALHALDVTGLTGLPGPTTASGIFLFVPYSASPNAVVGDDTHCGTPYSTTQCTNTNPPTTPVWFYSLNAGLDPQTDYNDIDYAFFGPASATPIPAALPLFSTGLGAMGLLGWRRKRKTQAVAV